MKVPFKRFSEEFYYYSSQLAVFFILIIFLTSGSLAMGLTSSLVVVAFMVLQTVLLVSQGHLPILRFLFSLITPVGYSILRAATSSLDFTETTNVLLWGAAVYIGFFQAVSLSLRVGLFKRVAEAALSLGSAVIFFGFYYYLDLRLGLTRAFQAGTLPREAYIAGLKIGSFGIGLRTFISSPQHLFALLGILSFDAMLLASRMRALNLKTRLDQLIETPASPEAYPLETSALTASDPAEAARPPTRHLITAVSSDIVGFTALSEMIGTQKSVDFLNRYYTFWTHAASSQGGRISSITGDSVIMLFGLVDEGQNPERALFAAYFFQDQLQGFREDLAAMSLPADFKISIGVHTGTVISALLGPPGEQKRNVFGDTIAVAARLDSLCRELHQELLVSHATFRRLSLESQATLERIGEVLLRQSTRPVPVYSRK
ncbi:MAG: adenylate/guanylate cyclase domain-containing protein [Spirochaetes bacterium]|nr:adenylate/guanylate cyclase domain-containing protein [Spirochaetota bacterium]